jgi:hypothetical protein
MRNLVAQWQREAKRPLELVEIALTHFREQPFVYTLSPPELGRNPADEFLFDTRRGFCEHYATAFTLLMRLGGIPARVVAGYQGGEMNPIGDYLIVRQSDAHAWTEIWLEETGWTRIDPTAAVAPERIERPIDLMEQAPGEPVRFLLADVGFLGDFARRADLIIDAINSGWQRWVLDYDPSRQARLLADLGLGFVRKQGLAIAMVTLVGVLMAILFVFFNRPKRVRPDPVQRLYLRFCTRLGRHQLARAPSEGPLDFSRRVIRERPDLGPQVRQITELYLALRYGRGQPAQQLRRLKSLVEAFRP